MYSHILSAVNIMYSIGFSCSSGLPSSNSSSNTKRTHYYGAVSQKSSSQSSAKAEDFDDADLTMEEISMMEGM